MYTEEYGVSPFTVLVAPKRTALDARRQALVKLTLEMARDAGSQGITVSDIRLEAYRKNILAGGERGRTLSFMGSIPILAGLVKTGRYVRSEMAVTHGNLQMVWLHPEYTLLARRYDADPYLD